MRRPCPACGSSCWIRGSQCGHCEYVTHGGRRRDPKQPTLEQWAALRMKALAPKGE